MTEPLDTPRRQLLLDDWFICSTAPGVESPPPERDAAWLAIPSPMPAAAAMRELGKWSIDGPLQQFDAQDWWYRTRFDAPAGTAASVLGFDGLATLAQVWLNGAPLLTSSNMFVSHRCDTAQLLRPRGNELLLRFGALEPRLQRRRPRPRWRAPMVQHQQLRWFRTTLLGRTPGWSPPAAVVGPWKDVWLERRPEVGIRSIWLDASVEGGRGSVTCRLQPDVADGVAQPIVDLRLERRDHVAVQQLRWNAATKCFEGQLRLDDVQLWWPHTHGEPALYQASVLMRSAGAGQTCTPVSRLGFRTIEVDTREDDFALRVNGVPVFCRGACWTPLDPVTLRSSRASCGEAVAQARAAGMNMLRVPGTTVYEEDHFYDACDEQGVLVWQDFMFANMDYPAEDPEFSACVEQEAAQQLQRLHARPCLAVLCGNSEAEQQAAMWGAAREDWSAPLFTATLAQLCAYWAPHTPYWPSSAHGGAFPHQPNAGTASYYGVGAYLRPLADARRADLKFATECLAFANVPAASALARMPGGLATRAHHPAWKDRSPRDLGAGWDFDDVRDHYLELLFNVDSRRLRSTDHDRYLALSRVASAEVMAAAFSEWRRPGSRCRGALVLMLRDLWAGAGWGVVDDAGVPKACWHYLRRALQPITVLLTDEGLNGVFAHVINESAHDRSFMLELAAWRGAGVQVASGKGEIAVAARGARTVAGAELLGHFMDLNYAYRFGPMPCDVVVATLRGASGEQLAQAFHFPGGLPAMPQDDAGLSAIITVADDTAELTVRTCRLALAVHFEIPGVHAQDEYFHLPPNGERTVVLRLTSREPPSGWVHALNSSKSARVQAVAAAGCDLEHAT